MCLSDHIPKLSQIIYLDTDDKQKPSDFYAHFLDKAVTHHTAERKRLDVAGVGLKLRQMCHKVKA